jgi:flagellin-specific chaperone FliS
MRHLMAYAQSQDVTLDGEQAFEELYARLARWTAEIIDAYDNGQAEANDQKIERSIALLGYMNRAIDLSHNYAIACAVLSLHRFVIGALVKAKAEGYSAPLTGVSSVLLALAELFATIRSGNKSGMLPGKVRR